MPTEQTNIEPGEIVEGKVQGITNFGAFIELPGGLVGLVHISEIADTYVKDVKDFIKEGDSVTVKVLNIAGKKIGLSIKQAAPPKPKPRMERPVGRPPVRSNPNFRDSRNAGPKRNEAPVSLDDKIAKFLKESDERMQPLKNKAETRKRGKSSRPE
ncbi:MAG: S1 RNA-binding domain-containing protein [Bacillota bacterium]|nr:S1 RNA-binding domain-containing protein [Bacillota bacterium]